LVILNGTKCSEESQISNAEILRGVDLRAKRKAQNDKLRIEGFDPYLKGIGFKGGFFVRE
jgi:hypothetical protein